MTVTTEDIARHLGVSSRWVRYALSGNPRVTAVKRERIQKVAAELGYDPADSHLAKSMAARRYGQRVRNNAIAVMAPEFTQAPFFASMLDGIQDQAYRWGTPDCDKIDICLFVTNRPTWPRMVNRSNVDGVIWLRNLIGDEVPMMERLQLPSVSLVVDQAVTHSLLVDNETGMREMVHHLARLGHRRIAYLGPPLSFAVAHERYQGFLKGLQECGLSLYQALIENTVKIHAYSKRNVEQLVNRTTDFTALICYNDQMAMQAVRYLEGRNLRVPQDISVTGFDNISGASEFPLQITSIEFDRFAMGQRAVACIYESFDNDSQLPVGFTHRTEVFPVELVVGDSTSEPRRQASKRPRNSQQPRALKKENL